MVTILTSAVVRKNVPDISAEQLPPFDYILVTTKTIPEVPPSVADIIEPAVTPGKTVIVLSQNGLNIEKPIIARFPTNPVISSISLISVAETAHGKILHEDKDIQKIGPFTSPEVDPSVAEVAARRYMDLYNAQGLLDLTYEADVQLTRWRKLVYNASFNTVAAALRMDTGRMRMSQHIIDDLVRPIMLEIVAAARAVACELPDDLPEKVIHTDPTDIEIKPSMCQDVEKGNLMEIETIAKQPLLEGESRGVPMPTLRVVYGILKGIQLKTMEAKGLWERKFSAGNPYQ